MIFGRRHYKSEREFKNNYRPLFNNPQFQKKYVSYLVFTMLGLSFLFFGPALYFLNQNYTILTQLAYDTHPSMIRSLERENTWFLVFATLSLVSIGFLTFWISLSMTQKIVSPLVEIEKHMREIVMGRWNVPDFENRTDEFKELTLTYEYLYRSLKSLTEEELKLLDLIVVDEHHKEAWGTWVKLINGKRRRLGLPEITSAKPAWPASVDSERRAS